MSSLRGLITRVAAGCALAASWIATSQGADLGGYVHRTDQAPYSFADTIVRLHFDLPRGIVYGDETVIIRTKHALS
ncbi:MAG: hypothetical protein WBG27_12765, partial [Candidatus Aquilonibacter sp.]